MIVGIPAVKKILFAILSATYLGIPFVEDFFGIENIPLNIERAKAAFKPASQNFDEKK